MQPLRDVIKGTFATMVSDAELFPGELSLSSTFSPLESEDSESGCDCTGSYAYGFMPH